MRAISNGIARKPQFVILSIHFSIFYLLCFSRSLFYTILSNDKRKNRVKTQDKAEIGRNSLGVDDVSRAPLNLKRKGKTALALSVQRGVSGILVRFFFGMCGKWMSPVGCGCSLSEKARAFIECMRVTVMPSPYF